MEKRVFVVPLQSISKANLLLPLVAKSKLSKLKRRIYYQPRMSTDEHGKKES